MPYKDPEVRKAKHAEYSKAHYEKNKAQIIENKKVRRKGIKEKFAAYKAGLKCTVCGENHPATLDFHHVERHKSNKKVFYLVSNGHHWPRIMEEVAKCEVLCANCHRVHHYEERLEKALAKN
jgi:hypothetical protein